MRAFPIAGTMLAALAIIAPVQAQGPYRMAPFASDADTTAADGLRARLDTTWLGASLLTPIAAPPRRSEQAPDTTRPQAFPRDTALPCIEIDCVPPSARPKRFWRGVGELMIVQLIPNAYSRIDGQEWAMWTPQSWATNLKFTWQWDNNQFVNNQFAHPYHGSHYFSAARSNGYSFWQSAPWAFGGSLMWELFFEVWAPSPNDLLMTTLGGITLGEMFSRMSALTLDNTSSGTERVFREIGAMLIDPVRSFNRAVDGTMFKRSRNPEEWRPSTIFANLEAGYRVFSPSEDIANSDAITTGYIGAALVYGSALRDVTEEPFSHFRLNLLVAFNPGENARPLSDLNVRGSLGGKALGSEDSRSKLAAFMTYEYQSNPMVEFGAQGFQGGWLHATKPRRGPMLYLDAVGTFNPIAAVKSDYFLIAEGRDYDYGIGLGGRGEARAIWQGKAIVGGTANYRFIPIISGFPGQHQLLFLNAEARYFIRQRWGLGIAYNQLWRWSAYTDRSDINRQSSELRLFLATAIPQWKELE